MSAPIVVAYDALREDRAPVDLALAVGEVTGAPVIAASVVPSVLGGGLLEAETYDPAIADRIDAALARLRGDAAVQTRTLPDVSVPRALHGLAEKEGAGLLVVGSTGRGAVGRVLPGSTAERLLHGAPCPVAMAPHGYAPAPIGSVAVGFVDTAEGHAALAAAHAVARRAGATLRVVTVLHPSGGLDAALAHGTPPPRGLTLEGRHRADYEAAMERAIAALPPGVAVESEVHVDDPAEVLLRISAHAGTLVCGSRGYGPVRSVLLGGVSRRVVDGARCPVLVLPRGVAWPFEERLDEVAAEA